MRQLLIEFNEEIRVAETQPKQPVCGNKSIRYPNRNQVEVRIHSLDELIPEDHRVRDVWEFVCKMDLSAFTNEIKVMDGCPGPRTIAPQVLLALWLFAMLERVNSARHIDRLCKEHHAYIWLCGGLSVNYHTLSDFRAQGGEVFRKVLQESIATLWHTGIFSVNETAQDGTRIKANAGARSMRRAPSLQQCLVEAKRYIKQLEIELEENPSASSSRQRAAKERAAKERKERLERAQAELEKHKAHRIRSGKENHKRPTKQELEEIRISTTDPECRKMRMGDGGFRPAYNVQFATTTDKKVIVGVDVVATLDPGTLSPMLQQVKENLAKVGCPLPKRHLADSAYSQKNDVTKMVEQHSDIDLYATPPSNGTYDLFLPRKTDSEAMKKLRERMKTAEAQEIYKKRASTAEFVNARTKNYGMSEVLVRGLSKVLNMALLYAVAHNLMTYMSFKAHVALVI